MSTRLTLVLALLLTATAARAQTPAAPAGTIEYYHVDALGSVRAVTNASGAVVRTYHYHPFGEGVGVEAGTDLMRFTGKPRDGETGLDYFGARYYATRTGRFTTVDPVMNIDGAMLEPQRWNRYSYVDNNPYRYVDPDGRERAQITLDQDVKQLIHGQITRDQYMQRIEARGAGAAVGASLFGGSLLVRGSMFAVSTVRLWVAAAAPLAGTSGKEMFHNAVARVQSFAGSTRHKVELLERLIARIERATGASWAATRVTAADGSDVFVGRAGEALIINGKGELFKGRLGEGIQLTKEGVKIVWDQVSPFKAPK